MPRQTTVLHVVGQMNHGGVECWLMDLLRSIDRSRFQFRFCTLNSRPGAFDAEIRSLGGLITPCPLDPDRGGFSTRFRSVLRETRYDAIHSHVLFFSGYMLRLASRAGIPVRIAHAHSSQDEKGNSTRRRLYRWATRRAIRKYCTQGIGCSDQAADLLFTPRWRVTPGYSVVPCAIDPSRFRTAGDRPELLASLGIGPAAYIVGHVGGLRRVKNHEFLLHVGARMISEDPRVHLLLIGDGPLRGEIETLAGQLGIAENVTFAGARNDVPVLLGHVVDLQVFPSRMEGLGLAVVEAQCAGVPSLVSEAIPREVAIIDELVTFESLSAGADQWARRALEIRRRPAYDKNDSLRRIDGSRFDIATSVRFFSTLYSDEDAARALPETVSENSRVR